MIPRDHKPKKYLAALWEIAFFPPSILLLVLATSRSVLVQVHNNYMLGIMRYSTAIIQYNPWETLEKKRNRTKGKNQRRSVHRLPWKDRMVRLLI